MADNRIKLNQLGNLSNGEIKYLQKGQVVIEVKTHIPYENIMDLIQLGLNLVIGDRGFVSAPLRDIIKTLMIIKGFTNLDISRIESVDCSAQEAYEMYDILESCDLPEDIKNMIDSKQLAFFEKNFDETLNSLIAYQNSAAGILDKIQNEKMAKNMEYDSFKEFLENDGDVDKLVNIFKMMGKEAPSETYIQPGEGAAK